MEALSQVVPNADVRVALLSSLPVVTLVCAPSHLGLATTSGLAQPRLSAFSRLQALAITPASIPDSGSLRCQLGGSPAAQSALRDLECSASMLQRMLQRLVSLDLSSNMLGETRSSTALLSQQLRHLSQLTLLNLSGNPLRGDALHIDGDASPALSHLNCSNCAGFQLRSLQSMHHLTALTCLALDGNNFIGQQAKDEEAAAFDTSVAFAAHCCASVAQASSAPVAAAIATLSQLQVLSMRRTQLSAVDLAAVQRLVAPHKQGLQVLWCVPPAVHELTSASKERGVISGQQVSARTEHCACCHERALDRCSVASHCMPSSCKARCICI